jgi:hypothetical protein
VVLHLGDRPEIYGILISMASVRAGSALDAWNGGLQPGLTRIALEAGVSAELIAKAFLAAHNPALLLPDRPSRDTLLHLTGQGRLAASDLHQIQTIGMTEAFKRARYLLPTFSHTPERDRDLITARNALAHLGQAPDEAAPSALSSMVRIHNELARAIGDWGTGADFIDGYWDDHAETVRHLVDESLAAHRRRALAKVSIAQRSFQRRYGRLETDERNRVASALAGQGAWAAAAELEVECPACGQAGVLAFDGIDVGEPFESPLWSTGEPALYVHQREEVLGFDCSVCGLSPRR